MKFGPGRLESIELDRRWQDDWLEVRAAGTYKVYCGNGNEHTEEIDSGWVRLSSLTAQSEDYDIADELVERELEDWTDPCEVELEGDDLEEAEKS